MSHLRSAHDGSLKPVHTVLSFDDFYRSEYRRVVNVVFAISGGSFAAEELAQEAFIKAREHWRELADHDNPNAWVRRVAINLAHSALRRRSTEAKVLLRLSRERPRVEAVEDDPADTLNAIRTLSPKQATAVTLRYFDDLSIEEIAAVLECEPSTVRVHLHRGRSALAARLGVQDSPESEEPAPARSSKGENSD